MRFNVYPDSYSPPRHDGTCPECLRTQEWCTCLLHCERCWRMPADETTPGRDLCTGCALLSEAEDEAREALDLGVTQELPAFTMDELVRGAA